MSHLFQGRSWPLISKQQEAERERERQLLREREEEVVGLRREMKLSTDRLLEMERDLESKEEIVAEIDAQRQAAEQRAKPVHAQNADQEAEIERLRSMLESKREIQSSWNSHSEALSNIVNDSVKDSNAAMVDALRFEFTTFML